MSTSPKHPNTYRPRTEPELQILLSLAQGRRHGYAIMLEVRERTDGRIRMGAGTLYASSKRMVVQGLIEEPPQHRPSGGTKQEGRRRYYELTRAGEEALVQEIKLMRVYLRWARERGIQPFYGDRNPPSQR